MNNHLNMSNSRDITAENIYVTKDNEIKNILDVISSQSGNLTQEQIDSVNFIENNITTLNTLSESLDTFYTKTQIDSNYYNKSSINTNYYNKTEIDNGYYTVNDIDTNFHTKDVIDNRLNSEFYNSSEIDDNFYDKIDLDLKLETDYYTKNEINNNIYNKVEMDVILDDKADKSNTYNKAEIGQFIVNILTPDYYEKTEIDGFILNLQNNIDNIDVSGIDLSNYVTNSVLTDYLQLSDLTDYVKNSDLTNYLQLSDLTDYVKNSDLNDYLQLSDLTNYYNKTEIDGLINPVVANASQIVNKQDSLVVSNEGVSLMDSNIVKSLTVNTNLIITDISNIIKLDISPSILTSINNKINASDTYDRSSIDLRIGSKAEINDVYTKLQIDGGFYNKTSIDTNIYTKSETNTNFYNKSEVDNKISSIPSVDSYTKSESDGLLDLKADNSVVYTQTEINSLLNNKATSSTVYTKTESNNLLNSKANTSDVYSKSEINNNFDTKDTITGRLLLKQDKLTNSTQGIPLMINQQLVGLNVESSLSASNLDVGGQNMINLRISDTLNDTINNKVNTTDLEANYYNIDYINAWYVPNPTLQLNIGDGTLTESNFNNKVPNAYNPYWVSITVFIRDGVIYGPQRGIVDATAVRDNEYQTTITFPTHPTGNNRYQCMVSSHQFGTWVYRRNANWVIVRYASDFANLSTQQDGDGQFVNLMVMR